MLTWFGYVSQCCILLIANSLNDDRSGFSFPNFSFQRSSNGPSLLYKTIVQSRILYVKPLALMSDVQQVHFER